MEQNELDVRSALEALTARIKEAMVNIGKDPSQDPLITAAEAALAKPGGIGPEYRHLLLGIGDVARSLAALTDIAIQGVNNDSIGRIGNPASGLAKAAKRLALIGTGQRFDWEGYEAQKETKGGPGETPRTTSGS